MIIDVKQSTSDFNFFQKLTRVYNQIMAHC